MTFIRAQLPHPSHHMACGLLAVTAQQIALSWPARVEYQAPHEQLKLKTTYCALLHHDHIDHFSAGIHAIRYGAVKMAAVAMIAKKSDQ